MVEKRSTKSDIDKRTWDEFRKSGLLWWINRALHLFGWAIAVEINENGKVSNVFPMKHSFTGFSEDSEERGFYRLREWMCKNIDSLGNKSDDK